MYIEGSHSSVCFDYFSNFGLLFRLHIVSTKGREMFLMSYLLMPSTPLVEYRLILVCVKDFSNFLLLVGLHNDSMKGQEIFLSNMLPLSTLYSPNRNRLLSQYFEDFYNFKLFSGLRFVNMKGCKMDASMKMKT